MGSSHRHEPFPCLGNHAQIYLLSLKPFHIWTCTSQEPSCKQRNEKQIFRKFRISIGFRSSKGIEWLSHSKPSLPSWNLKIIEFLCIECTFDLHRKKSELCSHHSNACWPNLSRSTTSISCRLQQIWFPRCTCCTRFCEKVKP